MDSSSVNRRQVSASLAGATETGDPPLARRGDLATAIAHRRSLLNFSFTLRVISILVSIGICIAIPFVRQNQAEDSAYATQTLAYPVAAMACSWSTADVATFTIKARTIKWWSATSRMQQQQRNRIPGPASTFSWGPPGLHIAAHLAIWACGIFMSALLWLSWIIQIKALASFDATIEIWVGGEKFDETPPNKAAIALLWVIPTLESILIVVHFTLFVLACIATDDKLRRATGLVHVARDHSEKDTVKALPASLWDVFYPKYLPTAVSVDQQLGYESVEGNLVLVRASGGFDKPSASWTGL